MAHPDRQVVLFLGDGAFGFSGMDFDTMVRHGLPVVAVVGNNGIWGLEKHPMQALYGYDVAADLQPGCRYDEVVGALGGAGELVEDPDDIGPALDRAFGAAAVPYVVNVLTDPANAYPRTSNLGEPQCSACRTLRIPHRSAGENGRWLGRLLQEAVGGDQDPGDLARPPRGPGRR